MTLQVFDVGPFQLYRPSCGCLSITLRGLESVGFEYGWRDDMRGQDHPIISIRVGKLNVLYLEVLSTGIEIWFMGFWWIPILPKGFRK